MISGLEDMIDKHSLKKVLEDLEEICYLKADHIESDWQDTGLAKVWERGGKACGTAARKANDLGI